MKKTETLRSYLNRKVLDKEISTDTRVTNFQYLINGKAKSLRKLFGIEQEAGNSDFLVNQQSAHLANIKYLDVNSAISRNQLNKEIYRNKLSENIRSHAEITKFPTLIPKPKFSCKLARNHSKLFSKINHLPSLQNKQATSIHYQESDLLTGW